MAGGFTSARALGIPIGQRDESPGVAATPTGAESVAPRGLPFVFVGEASVPGLVVEQRRGQDGWQVLVALVEPDPNGRRALTVRWCDAAEVTAAGSAPRSGAPATGRIVRSPPPP